MPIHYDDYDDDHDEGTPSECPYCSTPFDEVRCPHCGRVSATSRAKMEE